MALYNKVNSLQQETIDLSQSVFYEVTQSLLNLLRENLFLVLGNVIV